MLHANHSQWPLHIRIATGCCARQYLNWLPDLISFLSSFCEIFEFSMYRQRFINFLCIDKAWSNLLSFIFLQDSEFLIHRQSHPAAFSHSITSWLPVWPFVWLASSLDLQILKLFQRSPAYTFHTVWAKFLSQAGSTGNGVKNHPTWAEECLSAGVHAWTCANLCGSTGLCCISHQFWEFHGEKIKGYRMRPSQVINCHPFVKLIAGGRFSMRRPNTILLEYVTSTPAAAAAHVKARN